MRTILSITFLLCLGASVRAQVNLGGQVQGQLPAVNGQNVLLAAPSVSGSGGITRGANATNGYTETFVPDGRCLPGSSNEAGFDSSTNASCAVPGFYNAASGTMDLERTLSYGVTNAQPPSPKHASFTFSDVFGGAVGQGNAYVGLSTCTVGTFNCGAANEIGIIVKNAGLYLQNAGTTTALWAAAGNGPGTTGSTDSGNGNIGWGAVQLQGIYGFSFMLPGDGTIIVSAVPMAGSVCYSTCSFSARVPVTLPSGSFHQFFVRGGTDDYIGDVSLGDGFTIANGTLPVYDVVTAPNVHVVRMMRWALHANGTPWDYKTAANDITNIWALIPPNYNPNAANPWFLQVRGEEDSILSIFGTFANVLPALIDDGIVVAWGDWEGATYYGAPNDLANLASGVAQLRSALSLARRPHVGADSAGGIVVANAITHGVLLPQDWQCYSCFVNLLSGALGENISNQQAGVTQMPQIEADYGFTSSSQYATYTAGYDPFLVVGSPTVAQGPLTGTAYPLKAYGAQLLASVPLLAVTDGEGGDTTVDPNLNSIGFCAADNAINPGVCTLSLIGGGHVSSNKFVGSTALNFINSHP